MEYQKPKKKVSKRLGWTILVKPKGAEKFVYSGTLFQYRLWAEKYAADKFKNFPSRIVGYRYTIEV